MKIVSVLYTKSLCLFLNVHKLISYLLSPQVCLRCGNISSFILCPDCLQKFSKIDFSKHHRCRVCGKILVSEVDICMNCREEPLLEHTDSVFPIHSYRLWKKEVLFNWKFCGNRCFSLVASDIIHKALVAQYPGLPIVPVPPRPGKLRNKGWDQIDDVCRNLKYHHCHKVLPLLIRTEKKQQKLLNREERIHQMGHLYKIKRNKIKIPEEVVIIDDIMTTGVTLENCASVLKKNGVKKVHGVTLFIAD